MYDLPAAEWDRFVNALNAMKASGVYDEFIVRHGRAMRQMSLWGSETSTSRNVAHAGPSFFPWHRQYLREFELELQNHDEGCAGPGAPTPLEVPYWRTESETLNQWFSARIWTMMGGDGDPAQGNRVTTGPFSHWNSLIATSAGDFVARAGILRQFNLAAALNSLGSMTIAAYDQAPWSNGTASAGSFRRDKEGRHNTVHNLIRGDMGTGTSPNDPVFWVHHSNMDRIWATYQQNVGMTNYQPVTGGPTGHNLNDAMAQLRTAGVTPAAVLDWRAMGYTYDTLG